MDAPHARFILYVVRRGGPLPSCQNCAGFDASALGCIWPMLPVARTRVAKAAGVLRDCPFCAMHIRHLSQSGQSLSWCSSSSSVICTSMAPNSLQISIQVAAVSALPRLGNSSSCWINLERLLSLERISIMGLQTLDWQPRPRNIRQLARACSHVFQVLLDEDTGTSHNSCPRIINLPRISMNTLLRRELYLRRWDIVAHRF